MSMLTLYLIALGIGGAMVVITLVVGGDGDADADADADGHAEGGDHDGGGVDAISGWLPIASVRFWTFFAAGFGLTGTSLTALEAAPGAAIAIGSVAAGYVSGWGVVTAFRRLSREEVSSSLGSDDYVGAGGTVVLPVSREQTGKIRIQLKGRTVELLARTEEEEEIAAKQPVIVYAVKDDGSVVVSKTEKLPE